MTEPTSDVSDPSCVYPAQWERQLVLHDWRVSVRPVRFDDAPVIKALLEHVTADDLRLRFFAAMKTFSDAFLARLTDIDYVTAMAFIALDRQTREPLGVVRLHLDPSLQAGEYAILLRSDLKGHGLGWALMALIIEYAKARGLTAVHGQVLQNNTAMLKMCREFGFKVRTDPVDRALCDVELALSAIA